METSVSAQLYVMTPDSLCCTGKDNRPQNQHGLKEDDSKKDNVRMYILTTDSTPKSKPSEKGDGT